MIDSFVTLITFEKEGHSFDYAFRVDAHTFEIEDLGLRQIKHADYNATILAVEMSSEAFDWFVMHPTNFPERLPNFDFVLYLPNLFADDDRTNLAVFTFDAEVQQPELVGIIMDADKHNFMATSLMRRNVPAFALSPFMILD